MTTNRETYNLGTTISDETVTLTKSIGGKWSLELDGTRLGRVEPFETKLARASHLIPEHRRTGALALTPFIPSVEHRNLSAAW